MSIPGHVWVVLASTLIASSPHAQSASETLPATSDQKSDMATPMAGDRTYSTKKAPFANANGTTVSTKPSPALIPFGKSTASMEKPVSDGPRAIRAVPVENIDAIEAGEPSPAEPAEDIANPVTEDPAQPTELSAPIFSAQQHAAPRSTIVRVLNKVTARAEKIELKPDKPEAAGKLRLTASHCQHSDPGSLADDAALVTIAEIGEAKQPDKLLFSGWMYQSSPSINGVEHPVYDVSLVACKDAAPVVKPAPVVDAKPAKKKSPAKPR
jgi:hypothetical protein